MPALYVTSAEKGSGKTAICAGLGKQLFTKGKKLGFFKPVTSTAGSTATGDTDAQFMKEFLFLSEPTDLLRPVISSNNNLSAGIKEAYAKVAQGKDIVIIEGSSEQYPAAHQIAAALSAKVVIVEAYSNELLKSADSYKRFGQSLLGVVLNKVPKTRMEQAQTEAAGKLAKAGVNLLGVLPEDRSLIALTVGELAESIQGEILNDANQSSELVENIMLGALGLDPGPDYFGRKDNKAVILKSERPDLALAALQTSSRCLVLAGSAKPDPMVLNTAKDKNTPVIIAKDNVPATVAKIEDALVKTRFNQLKKLPRLVEIMEQHLNTQKLYQGIGVG